MWHDKNILEEFIVTVFNIVLLKTSFAALAFPITSSLKSGFVTGLNMFYVFVFKNCRCGKGNKTLTL